MGTNKSQRTVRHYCEHVLQIFFLKKSHYISGNIFFLKAVEHPSLDSVCVFVCVCVCVCVCVHIKQHAKEFILCVYIFRYMHIYIPLSFFFKKRCVITHLCVCVCIYTYAYIHAYLSQRGRQWSTRRWILCVCVCMYIKEYICIYILNKNIKVNSCQKSSEFSHLGV
jgi:hypothetical protein